MTDLVLGIETSCDETAASVVAGGRRILSSVVSSQIDLHAHYGGVVPELAGRAHLEQITPVIEQALDGAGLIDADGTIHHERLMGVAATVGPGLIGSLLVGVSAAKSLAMTWGLPFIGVNHLEGHLHAAFLEESAPELPVVVLLVSGGHTMVIARWIGSITTRSSVRPLTMPPEKRSTRWRVISVSVTPVGR